MSDIKKLKKILFTSPSLVATILPTLLTSCNSNGNSNNGNFHNINIGGTLQLNNQTTYLSKTEILRQYLQQDEFGLDATSINKIVTNINRYFTIEYPDEGNSIKYIPTKNAFWYSDDESGIINKLIGTVEVNLNYSPVRTLRSFSMATTTSLNLISAFSNFFGSQYNSITSQIVDVDLQNDEENPINNAIIEKTSTVGVFNISFGDNSINDKVLPLVVTYKFDSGEKIKFKTSAFSFGTQTIGIDDIFLNKNFNVSIDLNSSFSHEDILNLLLANVDNSFLSSLNLQSNTLIPQLFSNSNSIFSIDANNNFELTSLLSSLTYNVIENGISRSVDVNIDNSSRLVFSFTLKYDYNSSTSLTTDSELTPPTLELSSVFSFMNYNGTSSASYLSPSSQQITNMSIVSSSSIVPIDYNSGSNKLSFNYNVKVLDKNSITLQYNNCIFNNYEYDGETAINSGTKNINLPIVITAIPNYSETSRSFTATYLSQPTSTDEHQNIQLSANSSISNILKKSIANSTAYNDTLHFSSFGTALVNNSGLAYLGSSSTPSVTSNNYSSKSWLFVTPQTLYSDRAIDTGGDVGYTTNYNIDLQFSSIELSAQIESPASLYQYMVQNGKTNGVTLRELTNAQPDNVSKPSINFKGSYTTSVSSFNTIDNSTFINQTLANNLEFDYTFIDQTATSNPTINLSSNVAGASSVSQTKTTSFNNAYNYISFPQNTQTSIQAPVESGFLVERGFSGDMAYVRDVSSNGTCGYWRVPWWPHTTNAGNFTNSDDFVANDTYASNPTVLASKGVIPNYDKYNFGLNNKPTNVNLTTDINFDATNYGKVEILLEDSNHNHYSLFDCVYVYLNSNGEPYFRVSDNFNLKFQVSFYNPIDKMTLNGTYEEYTINSFPRIASYTDSSLANWAPDSEYDMAACGQYNTTTAYLRPEWNGDFEGDWYSRQGVDGADTYGFFPTTQTLSSFIVSNYSVLQEIISHESKTLALPIYSPAANDFTTVASSIYQFSNLFS